MRLIRLVPAALILCVAAPAFGQEWIEYYSRSDAFLVNFPKQPQVRDITYPTEFGLTLPAHLHVDEEGTSRFSVTVVDYSNIVEASRGAGERVHGVSRPVHEPGRQRAARRARIRGVELPEARRQGHLLRLRQQRSHRRAARAAHQSGQVKDLRRRSTCTRTASTSRRRRYLAMRRRRRSFNQSMGFLDKDGVRVRYADDLLERVPGACAHTGRSESADGM